MKYLYTGLSLKELKAKYGTSSSGFYLQNWYDEEPFFTEKPPKGTYEIDLGEDLVNLTYQEQLGKLKKDFTPIHPAILVEFILSHYKETKERLLENIWVRTSSLASDGLRVVVDGFGSQGLDVYERSDDYRNAYLGLASCRMDTKKKQTKKEIKEIEAWAVTDGEGLVADGSLQMAVYFNRKGANEWRRVMFGPKDKNSKVVKVKISIMNGLKTNYEYNRLPIKPVYAPI